MARAARRKYGTMKPKTKKVIYEVKKPEVYIVRVHVEIAGERLLVDRLTAEGAGLDKKYGETAVADGAVKKMAISKQEVFERAKYRDAEGREAFPAGGIRGAIRDAAVEMPELSKAGFNRAVTVIGDMLPLKFRECVLDEKVGRNSGPTGAPRLVIRPLYLDWSLSFEADLLLNSMNPVQLHSLIDMAGRVSGIGNWRPGTKKGGDFGRFSVKKFEVKEQPAETATAVAS